jgi:hypothetical protein
MSNNTEVHETDPLFRMLGAVTPVLVPHTRDRIVDELCPCDWRSGGLDSFRAAQE